jgi:hypothetical protein
MLKYDYKIDGYIFTPVNDGIKSGTHENMYKFKEGYDNSVDFEIRVTKDGLMVPYINGRILYNNYIQPTELKLNPNVKNIIECEFDYKDVDQNNFWKPKKIRYDKSHSNSYFCFKKTLLNIHENIQLHEFYL